MKNIKSIIVYNFLLLTLSSLMHGMEDNNKSPLQEVPVYADTQPFISKNYDDIVTGAYLRAYLLAAGPELGRAIISGEKELDYEVSAEELGSFVPQEEFATLGSEKNLYVDHNNYVDVFFENISIDQYNQDIQKNAQYYAHEKQFALEHFEYYLVENLLGQLCLHNDRHREYLKFILDNLHCENAPEWVTVRDIAKQLDNVQGKKEFPNVNQVLCFEAFLQSDGLGDLD